MLIILTGSLKITRNTYAFLRTTRNIEDVLKYPIFPNISAAEETTLIEASKISALNEVM